MIRSHVSVGCSVGYTVGESGSGRPRYPDKERQTGSPRFFCMCLFTWYAGPRLQQEDCQRSTPKRRQVSRQIYIEVLKL